MEAGVSGLADSRLPNLRRLRRGLGKVHLALLRGPMLSRAAEVVEYADVSFNTQLDREPGPPAD